MSIMSKKPTKAGVCPKCGSDDTEYHGVFFVDEQMYYKVSCCNCDWKGKEWYEPKFVEMTTDGE